MKGKMPIDLAQTYGERRLNFVSQYFWAQRYFVSTVGLDEETIHVYIRNQEK